MLTDLMSSLAPLASDPDMRLRVIMPAAALASSVLLYSYRGQLANYVYKSLAQGRSEKPGQLYLSGNFAPVRAELFSEDLVVEYGAIPVELEGVYLRNGPNPMLEPMHGYHWFDGDGMLHAVRLKAGKAAYCNHSIRTSRLEQETAQREAVFNKMGDSVGTRGLLLLLLDQLRKRLGFLDFSKGAGTANTALAFHAKRLLALHEADMPYVVKVLCSGVLETVGRLRLSGVKDEWKSNAFTAHPKLDAKTGDLMFFSYCLEKAPHVRVGLLDKHGMLQRSWDVDIPYPTMMHDMAATANYIVIMHMPLVFDVQAMSKNNGLPFSFKRDLPCRFGLLRRDAASSQPGATAPVQWFELPSFFVFHVANAYEDEDGKVKIQACHLKEFHFKGLDKEEALPEDEQQRIYEYCLDPATGKANMHMVSNTVGDFPVVHPKLACHKARYTWVARLGKAPGNPVAFTGVSKIDLMSPEGKDGCVGTINYPSNCFGGEAVFVPRYEEPSEGQEDDGWLVTFMRHEDEGTSKLHIFDAKDMTQEPLAVVRMPCRVPYGFHGLFVNEEQLSQQHSMRYDDSSKVPPVSK